MVLRAGALPQSFLSACLNCSGRTLLSLRELRALKIDCSWTDHRPIGGRAIGRGRHGASTGALYMKTFFKVVLWIVGLVVGLIVWNLASDFRPLVASILAAAFVCYVLSIVGEVAGKRVISDEQLELRSRLVVLDRKVTAILRDAFERRRLQ